MLILSLIFLIIVLFIATKFFVHEASEKIFILVFSVSTIYYGILGPWYWQEYRNSTYVGGYWGDQFPLVVFSFMAVYLLVVTTISVLGIKSKNPINFKDTIDITPLSNILHIFIGIGFISCGYAFIVGGALIENSLAITDDPLVLILFQFSDIPVGALLYWAASKGFDKKWFLVSMLYIVFRIWVGLRGMLAVFLGTLLIFIFIQTKKHKFATRSLMVISGICIVALFSIMTIARVKFSGLDLDVLSYADIDLLLYGLFAETNIVFGLASCLKVFGDSVPFVGIQPFTDVFVQFIPRFLYPEKDLYGHLKEISWWVGYSLESQKSGTAPPFFGEYYVAFGWFGLIVGSVIYSAFVVYLLKFIRKYSVTKNQYIMGAALVAVFIGFYYFSRGSIAQISKGMVFACTPYFFLLKYQSKIGISKLKSK